jgi:5'-3' exonuclease
MQAVRFVLGTQFMANLHEQLKYFIHVKLTTDPLWEGVDVHLSGHLVNVVHRNRALIESI